ncbi:30S ribosomal protein S4e [Candidatus Micrarchaeota archaeon RBG_16_49_10]|nr:MAG: 30S ribosomal protein S4e [Candidatus Micrarchaeota archaeon RBG_16_49_10]
MSHLKRILAPKYWKVRKKLIKWTVSPRPGPHGKSECIPLTILARDVLKLVDTGREAKTIVKAGDILVDGRPRKDQKYPVGFMDVVEIPKIKKAYRMMATSKGLELVEIAEKETKVKLCKITNKSLIEKGHVQLNLHDGRNIIIPVKDPKKRKEDVYSTGDSVLIELPSQKIVDHVKMEKGNLVLITGGQNEGVIAKIKDIITTRSREPNKLICEKEKLTFEAIKDYAFVIGSKKPLISFGDV